MLLRFGKGNRSQNIENPQNKDKTRYQHIELQSSQTQMPMCHHKIDNSQDNMSPLDTLNLTTSGPEICNRAEAQIKDFII